MEIWEDSHILFHNGFPQQLLTANVTLTIDSALEGYSRQTLRRHLGDMTKPLCSTVPLGLDNGFADSKANMEVESCDMLTELDT